MKLITKILLVLVATQSLFTASAAAPSSDGIWQPVNEAQIATRAQRLIRPDHYQTFRFDAAQFSNRLAGEHGEIELPMADGSFLRFKMENAPVMPKALADKYPQIRTWAGAPTDGTPGWARIDLTPAGFHGMIRTPTGSVFIDPYQVDRGQAVGDEYQVYRKSDYSRHAGHDFQCDTHDSDNEKSSPIDGAFRTPVGSQLRTYQTAIAGTAEYTNFHGGTVAAGLAAIVTALNRVTGLYETELSIRLELIPNNDQLIFTNTATDGYTNSNGFTMLGQNQSKLDTVIGSANYDIGHVFSTGGGGVAGLGVVCRAGNKGRGVTGLPQPIGDPFYVDYVAHEMGHQFGSNHTFNGTAGSCAGGNRNAGTAYEPGSGSTIMAYAGICSSHNIANASDAYFHTSSFSEIVSYTNFGSGNGCAAITNTGNSAPIVDAGTAKALPANTPIRLTGSAVDPDGDAMMYRWEEYDLGPGGAPNSPSGNAPIFRSFDATDSETRLLPRLNNILGNFQSTGEIMPTYTRSLRFRLVALDNQPLGGGVDFDTVTHTVFDTGGAFAITSQNSSTTWQGGTQQTVTWDVADTDIGPILCTNVDITLSTDGGQNFDQILLDNTPNDGSADIIVPESPSPTGRIKVECSTSIFFDINNTNINLQPAPNPDFNVQVTPDTLDVCAPDNAVYPVNVLSIGSFGGNVTLSVSGDPAGTTATFGSNPVAAGNSTTLTIGNTSGTSSGLYALNVSGTGTPGTRDDTVTLNLAVQAAASPVLSAPADAAQMVVQSPTLSWQPAADAEVYLVELATDSGFGNIIESNSVSGTSYNVQTLLAQTSVYFWRVTAQNACGNTPSVAFSFTTVAPPGAYCSAPAMAIPDGQAGGVSDVLSISDLGSVLDINVSLSVSHPYIGQLQMYLTNQSDGTVVEILNSPGSAFIPGGCPLDNIDATLDDEALSNLSTACGGVGMAMVGDWMPSNPLSLFDGANFTGDWTLQVIDNNAGSAGTLDQWCMTIVAGPPIATDTDNDGVNDDLDNCTLVANADQRDTDADGYGNACDPDLDNNGVVNFGDVSLWVPFFNTATTGDADFDGDGFANFGDYSIFPAYFLGPPGPSGIAP